MVKLTSPPKAVRLVVPCNGPLPPARDERPSAPDALHHEYVGDWGFRPTVPEQADRAAECGLG